MNCHQKVEQHYRIQLINDVTNGRKDETANVIVIVVINWVVWCEMLLNLFDISADRFPRWHAIFGFSYQLRSKLYRMLLLFVKVIRVVGQWRHLSVGPDIGPAK